MKTKNDLYIQLWISPIQEGLLGTLGAENTHTLIALSVFINKSGICNPSLNTLKKLLGLKDIGSVSKRIKKLENLHFQNVPILRVERNKKLNNKGIFVYTKNTYTLNPRIITIFTQTSKVLDKRIQQTKELVKMRQKLSSSFGFNTKR